MNKDTFKFFLYRLNKELRGDLFSGYDRPRRHDDEWLEEYLTKLCSAKFDFEKKTKKSIYTWAVRNYIRITEDFSSLVLARSTNQRESTIVTSNSLSKGDSVVSGQKLSKSFIHGHPGFILTCERMSILARICLHMP